MASVPATNPPDSAALAEEAGRLLSPDRVFTSGPVHREALSDGTGNRGIVGRAEIVLQPECNEEVEKIMAWCYGRDLALVTRGGGTGLAGGAVPDGGVVLSLERMNRVLAVDPELWRMKVEAGVRTATVQRTALENGLLFPPDPGAGEQSTIGGNLATNAGGPHAFKYGVTGNWVTGIEAVVPPGETIRTGGPIRKDVAGLDLTSLLVGSEGTLGIITSAWLRLIPAPEFRQAVFGFYPDAESGCRAISTVIASGVQPTALEFFDRLTLLSTIGSLPFDAPAGARFAVLAEADGTRAEVDHQISELQEAMSGEQIGRLNRIAGQADLGKLWNWRDGVSIAVAAQRGGKISEDVVVPGEHLGRAIEETIVIGRRHGLEACSWGHAGDGNLHSTFLVDLSDESELQRGAEAASELFEMAIRLGGSISGEHGIGKLKTSYVEQALGRTSTRIHAEVKRVFDPKMLLNPGKKIPRSTGGRDRP